MTALNYIIQKDHVCIAIDTLSLESDDRKPYAYMTKFILLPHLHTIVTGTGLGLLVSEWMAQARSNILGTDIDDLNQYTPDCLHKISAHYPQMNGSSTTIYHFGYSQNRDIFVCYAYRSNNNWMPEEILNGVGIKPAIKFEFESNFKLPNSFIKLMEFQREEDLKLPLPKRLGIGGDIHFIFMDRNGINVQKCHRFDSYEEDFQIMHEKTLKQNYRATFKTFQFGQAQGGRKFQPQEYIEYFED
ncbi:MAG: hypothetical protein KKC46_09015 [Proteobacteria bacterium]|nr:hypothetical protein [Pseudomonadota bacterium]